MELEPKITVVDLVKDHEKKPLEPQAFKACNLYLKHIKTERYKIKALLECFPSNPTKGQIEKSVTRNCCI